MGVSVSLPSFTWERTIPRSCASSHRLRFAPPEIARSAGTETVGLTTGTFLRLQSRRSIASGGAAIAREISDDLAACQPTAFNPILQTIDSDVRMVEIWRSNVPITTPHALARVRLVSP